MFNSNVQGWPVDPSSSELVSSLVSDYESAYGEVGVNGGPSGGMPIYTVPANETDAALSLQSGCQNEFLASTGTEVPIPSYAVLNGSSDSPLVIYQPSTQSVWELWQVTRLSSESYSACWGGKLDTASSDGVFPATLGLAATGISYMATTITEADVASGSIDHAVAVDVPDCNSYVYPAARGDCTSDPGQPAEGQWFRFPSSVNCADYDATPFEYMVCRAIQTYGMVITDRAGAVMIQAEQSADWAVEGNGGTDPITASWDGLPEYEVVQSLPWAELQVIDPPQ